MQGVVYGGSDDQLGVLRLASNVRPSIEAIVGDATSMLCALLYGRNMDDAVGRVPTTGVCAPYVIAERPTLSLLRRRCLATDELLAL